LKLFSKDAWNAKMYHFGEEDSNTFSVNTILARMQKEPICLETKKELLAVYLRQNALSTLSALPPEFFFYDVGDKEKLPELLPSIRGLSENESLIYEKVLHDAGKKTKPKRRPRLTRPFSKDESCEKIKRMSDLPSFFGRKKEIVLATRQVESKGPTVISISQAIQNNEHSVNLNYSFPIKKTKKDSLEQTLSSNLSKLLSDISFDSCDNILSSGTSEFY
jgi:hypothetical protein